MPKTRVIFYRGEKGEVPVLEWLQTLLKKDKKGYAKCVARIQQLADAGHELHRPAADYLRDEIYELRAKQVHVQYRILYFFHGQNVAILTHAITKEEAQVSNTDIDRAIKRKQLFIKNPDIYTYTEETANGED